MSLQVFFTFYFPPLEGVHDFVILFFFEGQTQGRLVVRRFRKSSEFSYLFCVRCFSLVPLLPSFPCPARSPAVPPRLFPGDCGFFFAQHTGSIDGISLPLCLTDLPDSFFYHFNVSPHPICRRPNTTHSDAKGTPLPALPLWHKRLLVFPDAFSYQASLFFSHPFLSPIHPSPRMPW